MKKFLSIFLSIVMLLSVTTGIQLTAFALSSSGSCGTNAKYTYNSSTGVLSITGSGAMSDYSSTNSPFYNQSGIKTVTIGNSITSIGQRAFRNCSNLTTVTIGTGVKTIGASAFFECTSLKTLTMPCTAKIYNYSTTFEKCESIERIVLTKGSTGIMNDYSNDDISADTYYGYTPWYISRKSLKELVIDSGVVSIGARAFRDCSSVPKITIANSVQTIGTSAFFNCKNLEELTIPCSTYFYNNQYTFGGCTNLKTIHLTTGTGTMNNYTTSTNSETLNCYKFTPWYISRESVSNLIIDSGIKNIGNAAFRDCIGLNKALIPSTVTTVGTNAFLNCSGFKSIGYQGSGADLEYQWTNIPVNAFVGCNGALCVYLPRGITSIGSKAFYNCSSLTGVYMYSMMNTVSDSAFDKCPNLNSIYWYSDNYFTWDYTKLGANNDKLKKAGVHYYTDEHVFDTITDRATTTKNGKISVTCVFGGEVKSTETIYYPKTITLSATKYNYDGKAKMPTVKVVGSDGNVISSSNYSVSYASGRKNPGKYNVKITFKGKYSGSVTKTFEIALNKTSISKLSSPKKGKLRIDWKTASNIDGYNVQLSTSSSFKKITNNLEYKKGKNTVTGSATTKKRFYARVRTYKIISGKKYYSDWSSTKSIVIK